MDLANAAAAIRPRSYWAAIDLGVLLVRTWWGPVMKSWLSITLPIYMALTLLCYPAHAMLGVVIFWWCLPLWERLPLHVMSRALFGHCPTVTDVIRNVPKLFKTDLIASLMWRRFSLVRSFNLPVTQLEHLRGERLARRLTLLQRDAYHVAFFWLLFCYLMLWVLFFGVIALIWFIIPQEFTFGVWSLIWAVEGAEGLLWSMGLYLGLTLVTPFYVGGGFALYLNRRVLLEGWDIELAFRRLAKRVAHVRRAPPALMLSMALSVFFMATLWGPPQAYAHEAERREARDTIETLLNQPPFVRQERVLQPVFDPFWNGWEERAWHWPWEGEDRDKQWFEQGLSFIKIDAGAWLKAILILLLFFSLMVLCRQLWVWRHLFRQEALSQHKRAAPGLSRDATYTQARVEALWQAGEYRAALAMLYQRLLEETQAQGVAIEPSDTERELMGKIASMASTVSDDTWQAAASSLVDAWMHLAYWHETMSDEAFLERCRAWDKALFSKGRRHS